jgi:glutathione S-transferase
MAKRGHGGKPGSPAILGAKQPEGDVMSQQAATLFHAPRTRSMGVLALLEEIEAPYELTAIDRGKGENQAPEFLAINPMGKVPALRDAAGAVVTEQVAIFIHLADLHPEAGLAPAIGDALRGPYLRWLAFYAACFEPALVDKARQVAPGNRAMSPYGEYETVLAVVSDALAKGPYLLGERFTAADILWGIALGWTSAFGLVPQTPEIMAYVQRVTERPAVRRARERDEQLHAAQQAG